jgi:hypothetical protein
MKTKTIVLSAVVVLALLAAGFAYVAFAGDDDARRTAALSTTRTYSSGFYFLELDGVSAGAIKSFEGCGVRAEPVLVATDTAPTKNAGQPKYGPCTIRFGSGMASPAYAWVTDALGGKSGPRNAAIVIADANYKAQWRLELTDAILTEFTVPALNAANKEAVYFELKLAPERISKVAAGGGTVSSGSGKAKALLGANFKVSSPALSLKGASKVDAWSFQIPLIGEMSGAERLPEIGTGPAEFDDVGITASEPLTELDKMVSDLAAGTSKETTLVVDLLDPTLTETLVQLSFTGVGLSEAELIGSVESSTETIAKRSFAMYVEGATLKFNSGMFR